MGVAASSPVRWSFVAALIVVAVPCSQSWAQRPPLSIGVVGGATVGRSSGILNVYPDSPECGTFSDLNLSGIHIGATALLRELFGPSSGLAVTIGWRGGRWEGSSPAIDPLVVRGPGFGDIVRIDREYHITFEESAIDLDLQWRGIVAGPLGVSAGVGLGYRLSGEFERTERLAAGTDYRFDSGFAERPLAIGNPLVTSPLRLAGSIGLDLDIPLSPGLTILPAARVLLDPWGPEEEGRLGSTSVSLGVSLLWSPRNQVDVDSSLPVVATTSPDTAVVDHRDTAESAPSHLTTSVEIYGVDRRNQRLPAATVSVYETIHRLTLPFPRAIVDPGESSEHAAVPSFLRPGSFDADSLVFATTEEILQSAPGLIATRLRERDIARLRLTSVYHGGGEKAHALSRARRVRSMLVNEWGIAGDRIDISTSPAHHERRIVQATIDSSTPGDTVAFEVRERHVAPPLLAVDRDYRSDVGIRRWRIEILHEDRRVGLFSSDEGDASEESLSWDISPAQASGGRSALIAELVVEDSAGTTARTRAPTPLIIDRQCRVVDRVVDEEGRLRIATWTLFPFAEGSSDIDEENESAIEATLDVIGSCATITIQLDIERGTGRTMTEQRGQSVHAAVVRALKRRGWRSTRVRLQNMERNVNPLGRDLPDGTRASFEVVLRCD